MIPAIINVTGRALPALIRGQKALRLGGSIAAGSGVPTAAKLGFFNVLKNKLASFLSSKTGKGLIYAWSLYEIAESLGYTKEAEEVLSEFGLDRQTLRSQLNDSFFDRNGDNDESVLQLHNSFNTKMGSASERLGDFNKYDIQKMRSLTVDNRDRLINAYFQRIFALLSACPTSTEQNLQTIKLVDALLSRKIATPLSKIGYEAIVNRTSEVVKMVNAATESRLANLRIASERDRIAYVDAFQESNSSDFGGDYYAIEGDAIDMPSAPLVAAAYPGAYNASSSDVISSIGWYDSVMLDQQDWDGDEEAVIDGVLKMTDINAVAEAYYDKNSKGDYFDFPTHR